MTLPMLLGIIAWLTIGPLYLRREWRNRRR